MNSPNISYNFADLKNHIKLVGRSVIMDDKLHLEMTASGFEICCTCQGDVILNVNWSGEDGLLGVIINDDFENITSLMVQKGTSNVTIAESLPEGNYKFKIVKLNEYLRNQ